MTMKSLRLLPCLLLAILAGAAHAADVSPAEARLRDALRGATQQLRAAQDQVVEFQAAQAATDKEKEGLQGQIKAAENQLAELSQKSAVDKAASDKAIAGLNAEVSDQAGKIVQGNEALEKWKAAYNQAAEIARAKEAARAKLAEQLVLAQRIIADRETQNLTLYKIGSEILTRYEKFSLGEALSAKEPFVGTARVRLENQIQDYEDKLADQKIKLSQAPLPAPAPATP
jgi:hypothetical protein